ncbi:MAG TPA: phosphotransferase [Gemmataceae bacterium]|nr:phosphotransferase [Gemmataceae bacterium]
MSVAGGFSGARVWRVGELCLRAWPESGLTIERLSAMHRLMDQALASGLEFVPTVLRTRERRSYVEHTGRLWDLTTWMPGRVDFHTHPTAARLDAACTALARLHAAWVPTPTPIGPCPAVLRRLTCAREWLALVASGWRPALARADPISTPAERAWRLLQTPVPPLPERLTPWLAVTLPLQPCLCDVWHDHVLFEGDVVRGLVDYGSVKVDHVAVDLARLLGSLVPDDTAMTAIGLAAYGRMRSLTYQEQTLVGLLDETGVIFGAANWLRWLYHEGRHFEDRSAVAARLSQLVARLERRGE